MNKTEFYLSQCADAASKSSMCFTLGAVIVKGGKVISSGYNHHRPHYDGADVRKRGHRKPVSMHAEMHAIFNLTGMSPSFRKQQGARGRRSPRVAGSTTTHTVFNGLGEEGLDSAVAPSRKERRSSQSRSGRQLAKQEYVAFVGESSGGGRVRDRIGGDGMSSGMRAGKRRSPKCCDAAGAPRPEAEKAWSARRRDPRINGADIYVARVTKVGMGSARPCWRCVVWCRWAEVKRIFHWNGEDGKFDVVKVNTAEQDQYETHADIRLYAGMGW
ncbi:hypothetical protein BGW80DRAFT_1230368 [Lactifluus volemus]|nr:hypothetical protein BGW80DRAFT_1230368 [Lactifluus volemus]